MEVVVVVRVVVLMMTGTINVPFNVKMNIRFSTNRDFFWMAK